ncbi:MAG: alpha-2-macroglobulin family protein [Myxococcota bacterium]
MRARLELKDAAGVPVAGHVTFMAVDEGVLSLTGYVTPDPHAAVIRPRGLASVTSVAREREWQRLSVDLDREKSDWGGDGETGATTNFRTAFATTAAFMPDVVVDQSGVATAEFDLPDNLTSFRLMAVAATEDGRFGSEDTRIEVSKPLTVRPGLPRFLSVGDTFEARAIVQAVSGPAAGPVEVSASITGPVVLDGPSIQTLVLDGGRAQAVVFKAHATAPGRASFAFKARDTKAPAGTAEDAVGLELPVSWPAPTRRALAVEHLLGDTTEAELELKLPESVRDDVGGLTATVSATELGELLPGLRYLVEYPYGCVEQTTSATLPLLVMRSLDKDFELPGVSSADVLARAQSGLDRLRGMQTESGGLGYWPGDLRPHPWGSVYGGYALVMASKMDGLHVPDTTVARLLGYLRAVLAGEADSDRDDWSQEISVVKPFAAYVLALAGKPEAGYAGVLYEERENLPDFGKALLALAIHEGKGDAKQVESLLAEVMTLAKPEGDGLVLRRAEPHYWESTMDSDARSTALALMALLGAAPNDVRTAELGRGLLALRGEGGTWDYDTQATAFATIALGQAFAKATQDGAAGEVVVALGDDVLAKATVRGNDPKPLSVTVPMATLRAHDGQKLTVRRGGELKALHATLALDWTSRELAKAPVRRGMAVKRRIEKVGGDGHELSAAELNDLHTGDMLSVTLTVTSPESRGYVAVDDLLPAGLEPVTTDFATARSTPSDSDGSAWTPFSYAERRDDRVLLFANELPQGSSTSQYIVRATTKGRFTLPSARAHAMYHPEIFGLTASSEVTIQ